MMVSCCSGNSAEFAGINAQHTVLVSEAVHIITISILKF